MGSAEEDRLKKNDILGKIMLKVSSFPSMPQAGVKLMGLLKKKDVPIVDIEKIARQDPGLTANVLKLANSAYFGVPSKIGSLKQAIILLGTRRFYQIAFAACMSDTMDKAVEGYDMPPGDLWRHSIAVSKIAETITKYLKMTDEIDFFTPALLHDMGKLVLGIFVKDEFQAINNIAAKGVPQVMAENMILGIDHAEIGAQILASWSLPIEIVNAVRWHHIPERMKTSNMQAEIVYLSNLLCQKQVEDESYVGQDIGPSLVVLDRLGLTMKQYNIISDRVSNWINELSDSLNFD